MQHTPVLHVHVSTLLAIMLVWSVGGCKDNNPISNLSDIVFPDSAVSYSRHVQPLFQQRCAFSTCHAGSSAAAGLDLTSPSYHNLLNHQPRLVTSGEPDNSLLVQRLEGTVGPRMPLNSLPLTQNQIRGIRRWILEGAAPN
jgi:hypothetical protein